MSDAYQWRRVGHIPLIIILQIIFVILFAKFVQYDEHSAVKNIHFDKKDFIDKRCTGLIEQKGGQTTEKVIKETDDAKLHDENGKLHETTKDAKETLTDYPSKHYFQT